MVKLSLSELAEIAGARADEVSGDANSVVCGFSANSQAVQAQQLFVCMPSASRDTHEFLRDAAKASASAAIVHSEAGLHSAKQLGLPALLIEPTANRFNFVLGRICRALSGLDTRSMRVYGITGTNGKTSTAWFVRNALVAMGRKAAYLGTLGFQSSGELETLNNTTPFPVELWQLLVQAQENGIEDVVMEVSSHALFERRLSGVQFDVGVFTNLSQDHLDFHGTMEEYASAKKLLFTEAVALSDKPFVGVLNTADERGQAWAKEVPCRVLTFGLPSADLYVNATSIELSEIRFRATFGKKTVEGRLNFGGVYNVENASAALACLVAAGFEFEAAVQAMMQVPPVPGRFEPVINSSGIGVIIDYAHTPEALSLLLKACRDLTQGRLITVFGCGGDRDRSKRPKMAEAASRLSDLTILTSDNPRTESPEAILDDIAVGIIDGRKSLRIVDRREAVAEAILLAQPGDIVAIAGKGHENYQIIGRIKSHLDDRELAAEALERRGSRL
ncbi:UDP-N-acetylmuramoyl-L-alanyl-D-glutamate--2,6-diaminopimelate ligase [Kamptonema cortianum]|nr:UDP-N-acetylmuramoyl-L-alanyl-D-glutamate--2,6-diaminopimelate ligase [Kamptonema cortianum]